MRTLVAVLVYFSLFLAGGYFLLRFFSGLVGLDMVAAFGWGFKAKRFELILPLIMFYLIAFFMVFAIFMGLFTSSTASFTHLGGLRGYQDGAGQYQYFDPLARRYTQIPHYNAMPVARKLDETFSLVSFYKPLFSGHYQNVSDLSLLVSVIKIVIALIGLVPLYLVLVVLAKDFGASFTPAQEVTHALIGKQFSAMTGYSALLVAGVIALAVVGITLLQHYMERRIVSRHQETLGTYATEYRELVTRRIAVGDKITGKIIRRDDASVQETYYDTQDDTNMNRRGTRTLSASLYTLEISGQVPVPVYIGMQLAGDADTHPGIRRLDAMFADKKSERPAGDARVELTVNQDYSVSLSPAASQPAE